MWQKGIMVDGPNRGATVQIHGNQRVVKIIDPREFRDVMRSDFVDAMTPLAINTYYAEQANPFAKAYGFDLLLRFQHGTRY